MRSKFWKDIFVNGGLLIIPFCILFSACSIFKNKNSASTNSNKNNISETVRTVYFIRHAKSNHDDSSLTDFFRPLDSSGVKDAITMNSFLRRQNPKPDYVLMSPSVRTKQTFQYLCKNLVADSVPVVFDTTIYRCLDEDMLKAIAQINDKYKTIFVVGHNPTITNMSNRFQQEKKIDEVSTAGIVALRFKINSWKEIEKSQADLLFYETPRRQRNSLTK